jgi:putative MATE family efflux protein
MVMEMVMESVFAVVDVFWVAHLGPNAVATVGLTESVLTLVYTAAMGLSIGVTAMVARRIGEKNPAGAAEAAVQGIALGLIVAAVVGTAGALLAPRLLEIMGASPEVIAVGSGYTRVMLGGNAVILLLFLINAIFRGAGDAAIAMRVLWLANAINILLGPCFIFGLGPFPELGVTGAAVATTIGRGTGVLYQLYRLVRRDGRVVIQRDQLELRPAVMRTLLRLSGTGTFQVLVGTASWIGLVRIISTFGAEAVAGYTIGIRIIIFALLPSWGLSNAAATMVGQGPRRRAAGACGAGRVARRLLQYAVPRDGGVGIRAAGGPDRPLVHHRPRRGADSRAMPAGGQLRVPVLRVRDGAHTVVQRSGRHLDTDLAQPLLLLAVGDPARLGPFPSGGVRAAGRIPGRDDGVLDARGRERGPVPARAVEAAAGLGTCRPHIVNAAGWGGDSRRPTCPRPRPAP